MHNVQFLIIRHAKKVLRQKYLKLQYLTLTHYRYCPLAPAAEKLLRGAFERMGYSARAYDRILRVARTIADMNGVEQIGAAELMEALQYRRMDRAVGK